MKSKEIHTFRKTYTKYEKECVFEGYKLAVLFDEKDDVKRYGGRWDADAETWWMPAGKLLDQIHDNGTLVRDWLNDSEMIMGQYGKFNENEYTRNLFTDENDHYTEYTLFPPHDAPKYKVQFFYEQDVAKFIPVGVGDLAYEYLAPEDGRKRWNVFISMGYNRVENS